MYVDRHCKIIQRQTLARRSVTTTLRAVSRTLNSTVYSKDGMFRLTPRSNSDQDRTPIPPKPILRLSSIKPITLPIPKMQFLPTLSGFGVNVHR